MKLPQYSDHLEKMLGEALFNVGIKFLHDSQTSNQRLDFYLPEYDVYIEIKQYHSDRISEQLMLQNNVIVLQGIDSVRCFILLLNQNDRRPTFRVKSRKQKLNYL